MFKSKAVGIVLVVVSLGMLVIGFFAVGNLIVIKYWGKKVSGTVTTVPTSCDKYNHIQVQIGDSVYEVSINRGECREGTYKVGQQVELIKHRRFKELVWPGSSPELVVGLMLLVIGYLFYEYRSQQRKAYSNRRRKT